MKYITVKLTEYQVKATASALAEFAAQRLEVEGISKQDVKSFNAFLLRTRKKLLTSLYAEN